MARRESDWYDETPAPTVGAAHPSSGGDDPSDLADFAAILWVPDPEQRHGWRELWVRKPDAKPASRPMGFGRPGDRR